MAKKKKVAKKSSTKPANPRGYTTHGYPAVWRKTMDHDECMAIMNEQIKLGLGKKFAVKKPKPVRTAPTGRRGYTLEGYPIVWLRTCSKEECLEHLKNGTSPAGDRSRVRTSDTKELVQVQKNRSGQTFDIAGFPVAISADKYCYTLTVDNHNTYYRNYPDLLAALRQSLIRNKVRTQSISDLASLFAAEQGVTKALKEWTPGKGFDELLG